LKIVHHRSNILQERKQKREFLFVFNKKTRNYLYENLRSQMNSVLDHFVYRNNALKHLHTYVRVRFQVNSNDDDSLSMNRIVNENEMLIQVVAEQNVSKVVNEYLSNSNGHVHLDHDLKHEEFRSIEFDFKSIESKPRPIALLT